MSNFKELYNKEIVPKLMQEYNYTTVMEVPKLEKIVINMGVGDGSKDEKFITAAVKDLELITGQKPVVTKARKSIAGFKVREGQPIGVKVTLRGENMYYSVCLHVCFIPSKFQSVFLRFCGWFDFSLYLLPKRENLDSDAAACHI